MRNFILNRICPLNEAYEEILSFVLWDNTKNVQKERRYVSRTTAETEYADEDVLVHN